MRSKFRTFIILQILQLNFSRGIEAVIDFDNSKCFRIQQTLLNKINQVNGKYSIEQYEFTQRISKTRILKNLQFHLKLREI